MLHYIALADRQGTQMLVDRLIAGFMVNNDPIAAIRRVVREADVSCAVARTCVPVSTSKSVPKCIAVFPVLGFFREPKPIGRDIDDALIAYAGGYDQNFCLNGSGLRRVAEAVGEKSGIRMTVETTLEGVQLYTANFLTPGVYKDGKQYVRRGAFCMETQHYPDAVNHENFPSAVLKAGEEYRETTIYRFDTVK